MSKKYEWNVECMHLISIHDFSEPNPNLNIIATSSKNDIVDDIEEPYELLDIDHSSGDLVPVESSQ